MSKKVSLKDAFVRSGTAAEQDTPVVEPLASVQIPVPLPVQPAVSPSIQLAVHTATQTPVSAVIQPPSLPQKKKATFNLDASLHQRLKIAAAIHSREMVDIVEDALQAYLPALDQKAG